MLDATVRWRGLSVLEAQVCKPVVGKRQTDVCSDRGQILVRIRRVGTVLGFERNPLRGVLQYEVQYPSDGIGAVLRRRPVTKYIRLRRWLEWPRYPVLGNR